MILDSETLHNLAEIKWLMKAIGLLCHGSRGSIISYVLTKLCVRQNLNDGITRDGMHELLDIVIAEEERADGN